MEKWINKHVGFIQVIGGILATAITLTAYAYTTFSTKAETNDLKMWLDKRLDRIEQKQDQLYDKLAK